MLTKEKCENALNNILCNIGVARSDYRTSGKAKEDYCTLNSLIEEHFDNPQINWLKNCMGEEAFNLIFSSQEEVNKWFDRMRWHVKKCDEYGRELDILKNNPPLKFEELKEKTWYWYEPSKSWIYLFKPLDWEPVKGLRYGERIINHSVYGYYMDFKEGTLFRKQVEE
jgi:hypothetical protein